MRRSGSPIPDRLATPALRRASGRLRQWPAVAEVLRDLCTGGDAVLDTVLAQALVAIGDWDGAIEMFEAIRRRAQGAPLPVGIAWRFGALLYLRSETNAAEHVLLAAVEAEQIVDFLVLGSEENHRQIGFLPQPPQRLHAVHARHLDVEDRKVRRTGAEAVEREDAPSV